MEQNLTQTELAKTITQAVAVAFEAQLHIDSHYHKKHHEWIEQQIAHEKARAEFWSGLAAKSLPSLVWSAVVAIAVGAWHLLVNVLHLGTK